MLPISDSSPLHAEAWEPVAVISLDLCPTSSRKSGEIRALEAGGGEEEEEEDWEAMARILRIINATAPGSTGWEESQ